MPPPVTQVIQVPGAESPLFQALQGMLAGMEERRRIIEDRRRREREDQAMADAQVQRELNAYNVQKAAAAETPIEMAPQTDPATRPAKVGVPPLLAPPEPQGEWVPPDPTVMPPPPMEDQTKPGNFPEREATITIKGKKVPLRPLGVQMPPLQYKQEVQAQKEKDFKKETELEAERTGATTKARIEAEAPAKEKEFLNQVEKQRQLEKERDERQYTQMQANLTKEERTRTDRLRNDYLRDTKKLRDGIDDLKRFSSPARISMANGGQPTPTDQFALIYAFNKALDPTSVVREGEFYNTRYVGAGLTDRARLIFNKLKSGEQLNPKQVQEMLDTIDRSEQQQKASLEERKDYFRQITHNNGLDAALIFGGSSEEEAPAKAATPAAPALPKTGEVVRGWRYKGPSPATAATAGDKNNWEKVQ